MGRTAVLAAAWAAALLVVGSAAAGSRGVPASHSFVWPASGTITRPFGYDSMGFHPGVDIGSLRSLDVTAAVGGVVAEVGYPAGFEGYGQIVLVAVSPRFQTLYAHLSQAKVHMGEHVVPGELVGIAGCTGICTGTHLHFEVRLDGKAVNPMRYLPSGIPQAPGPQQLQRLELARAARLLVARLPSIHLTAWFAPPPVAPRDTLFRTLASVRRPFP